MSVIEDRKFHLDLPEGVDSPVKKSWSGVSVAFIGSTRSGKTTGMKYVLNKYFKSHLGVLMTNSLHSPIYNEIDCGVMSPIYSAKTIAECYKINKETKNHYPFLIILDDIVDKKFDKEMLKLLTIYRNSGVSCILTAQATTILNASGRTNINFVLLFKLNSDEEIEKAVKKYLGSYLPGMKTREMIEYYRKATDDHHFFVVDTLNGEVYRTKINLED
jgi:AAA+ superfamily predicted ATPase